MKSKAIAVVTPCYNEFNNIEHCINVLKKMFDEELPGYELQHIICDNASTDGTVDRLRQLVKVHKHIKVILNRRNYGILLNTYNGVISSTADATVLFFPVDLQDPVELIPKFVKKWEEGFKIVYGRRVKREEFVGMRIVRQTYYRLLSRISSVDYPAYTGDFQLVDHDVIRYLRNVRDTRPFLRMLTFESGYPSFGIDYTWVKGIGRRSHNSFLSAFGQAMNGIVNHSVSLVRLCMLVGFLISALSIIYGFYALFSILFFDTRELEVGIATLIVGNFFLFGLLFLFLGIIGEYTTAIFTQLRSSREVEEIERINF